MSSDRREKDHERYLRNRERIIAYNYDYYHNFLKKGLRKPRPQTLRRGAQGATQGAAA